MGINAHSSILNFFQSETRNEKLYSSRINECDQTRTLFLIIKAKSLKSHKSSSNPKAYKMNTKGLIHDCLMFLKIMTTSLTTTLTKVLVFIKKK